MARGDDGFRGWMRFGQETYDIEISGVALTRDVDCEGRRVHISGAENKIVLTGACKLVAIDVANNVVTIERTDSLLISGSAQKVTLNGPTRLLEVQGSDSTVTGQIAGEGASIEVSGAHHRVAVTLMAKAAISVAGADHDIVYWLTPQTPKPDVNMSGAKNNVREGRQPR